MKYNKIQSLYSSRADIYHFFIHAIGYVRGVKKFLLKNIILKPHMNILDAGCGAGLLTKLLYKQAEKQSIPVSFYCFDFTPVMLDRFRLWITKNNARNIHLAQANILKPETIPTAWPVCDSAMVSGMLEYIPKSELPHAIQTLAHAVTPQGYLLLFICNTNWLNTYLITRWWRAHTYTKNELIQQITHAGFDTPTFYSFPWPYFYLNSFIHIVIIRKP